MGDMQTAGTTDVLHNWVANFTGIDPRGATGTEDPATKMDADWNAAVKAGDWKTAAIVVNGFSPDDLQKRLKPLPQDQRAKLLQGALDGGIGPDSAVAQATRNAAQPAPPPAQPGQPSPQANPLPGGLHVPIEGELPVECEGKGFGGKIQLKWKGKIAFKAMVGEGKDGLALAVDSRKALALKAVTEWWKSEGKGRLGGVEVITEQKFETEGAMSTKEGVTVKAIYTVTTPIGSVAVSGTLLKWQPGHEPEVGVLEGSLVSPELKLPDIDMGGVPIHDMKITTEVGFEIEPKFVKVIADAVIERLKSAVVDGAKQVATDVAVDVAIDVSLILVAIGVVAGTVVAVSESIDHIELVGMVGAARERFISGLDAALEGRTDPGGDWQSYGWRAGDKVVADAIAAAKQKNPGLDDVHIRMAVVDKTRRLVGHPAIKGMMHEKTGKQFWSAWVATHQGYTTTTGNARDACAACFGGAPMDFKESHPHMQEWMKVSKYPLKDL